MIDIEKEHLKSELRGSLLLFIRYFYKYITGREFIVSQPIGRESHHVTICRAYTKLIREQKQSQGLYIAVPPGYGKSVITSMWIAWCFTHYPDCNFLYISYSHDLASRHTSFIKSVMSSHMYKYLFDIGIKQDSRAKDRFETQEGGSVSAFGSTGSIVGTNAGLPGLDRFSGAVIMDDPHKISEIHSDVMRETVINNYKETILQRPRDVNVPIVFIGQRAHQDDLGGYILSGKDIRKWDCIILKGLDERNLALYPEVQPAEYLMELREKEPFVFCAQIQQDPVSADNSLFKKEWFSVLEKEPDLITTFITADTAETDKSWNDASVFSFWGLYEIEYKGKKTGQLGLHWIDCVEMRLEPKDLKDAFIDFYSSCSEHHSPPMFAAIEKKSTGVTLISVLREFRGLRIREIDRNRSSGSKANRFLEIQPYVASKQISFTEGSKNVDLCINHMTKINAAMTHRFDDVCDTLVDAIKIALIDKTLYNLNISKKNDSSLSKSLSKSINTKINLIRERNGYERSF